MNHRRKAIQLTAMLSLLIFTGLVFAQSSGGGKSPVTETWVFTTKKMAVTLPLYTLKNKYVSKGFHEAEEVKHPNIPYIATPENFVDPVLQRTVSQTLTLNLGANFDGIGNTFSGPNGTYADDSVPPDTDMAAGTTQIVSLDNSAFAVFSKSTGAAVGGPYDTNVLWSALGTSNDCYVDDDGDGIVKFDQLAQRWIITQFQVTTSPFHQCMAISQTADATGSWTVFEFVPNPAHGYFGDYPKLAIWPNVYSMTFDFFNASGTRYEAGGICGMNRAALLASNPTATIVCASLASTDYALLPVDLDGSAYPPSANTNALYLEQADAASGSALYMYSAAYNFTANTVTVGAKQTISVASYSSGCGTTSTYCITQPAYTGAVGSTVQNGTFAANENLDSLEEHLMFRAAYRNFGSYESLTLSHTVKGSGTSQAAERWYEIRSPFGTPTVYQQSTWSPDSTLHRWMGSIAQDHQGDIALGYSGSNSSTFPSVYVAGRQSTDTLSTMESEIQLYAGQAQQVALQGYSTVVGERWGDYSAMMLDPDDCTFWYTGEYLKQVGSFNWSTRVLSFSFPSCTSTAALTFPQPSTTLTGSTATFLWMASNVATNYWIDIGKEAGGNEYYQSGTLSSTTFSAAVNSLPTDGSTVYVTLYSLINGSWVSTTYTYTASGTSGTPAVMQTPTPGSNLTGSTVTFTWAAGTNATAYWIDAGSTVGGSQYYQSGNLGNVLTKTISGLPTNGTTVYVTLYSLISGNWQSNPYTYTAYNLAGQDGVMTAPTPGSTLTSSTATFTWTAGAGASAYWLDAGSTPGGSQYYQSGNLGNVLTTTVSTLPTDGSTIYVTLYSLIGSTWSGNSYTYTAFNATSGLAIMQTPVPGTFINGNTATFTWSLDANATAYWVDISAVAPGGNDVFQSGNLGNVSTVTVNSLPGNGTTTLYVTLYSYVGGQWLSNGYTYSN